MHPREGRPSTGHPMFYRSRKKYNDQATNELSTTPDTSTPTGVLRYSREALLRLWPREPAGRRGGNEPPRRGRRRGTRAGRRVQLRRCRPDCPASPAPTRPAYHRALLEPSRLSIRETVTACRAAELRPTAGVDPSGGIMVGQITVRSLMPSLDEVNGLLQTNNIDILCVAETWLSTDIDDRYLLFPGYCVSRRDREGRGGGLCVIYRDSLVPVELDVPTTGSHLETLWLHFTRRRSLTICVAYRPPSSRVAPVMNDFRHQLTHVLCREHPIYVLGDLNWDVLQPSKPGVQQYLDLLHNLSLSQLITTPTRSAPSAPPSLLDHLITSHPGQCDSTRVVTSHISDHDLIVTRVTGTRIRRAPRSITVRSTRHLNKDHLCLDLLTADWSSIYEAMAPSEKYGAWLTVWDSVINQHMPFTQIKVRNSPCPWVSHGDEDLRQLIRDRDSARAEDRSPSPSTWHAYRGLRNAVKSRLATARTAHFRDI